MRDRTMMPATMRVPLSAPLAASAFLIAAIALGGGGSPAPLPELILELLAFGLIALSLLLPWVIIDWQRVPQTAWRIAALTTLVPLLQLIPLPPIVWHALPARDLEVRALALIGSDDTWRTWSMAPSRTLSSLLSLTPPLLALLMTSALGQRGRQWLIFTIAAMTLASLLLGALQLSAGDFSSLHFYGVNVPMLVGFQANHNATADLLLIGLMAVPLVVVELVERRIIPNRPVPVIAIAAAGSAVVVLGVVLTASRMGIMLLPIPLIATLWILRPWLAMNPRRIAYGLVALVALVGLGVLVARGNPVLEAVVARFDFSQELRPQLWRDGLYVAQKYFPFGVGMGDFVPALIADERLEVIWPSMPNRAHNDFLELACEAGIFGLAALSAISWTLARALWTRLRSSQARSAALAVFAGASLAILSLHSLVDYPFRSMALACLGAVCAGLLLDPRQSGETASAVPSAGKMR